MEKIHDNLKEFFKALEEHRNTFKAPFKVSSGYRSKELNDKISNAGEKLRDIFLDAQSNLDQGIDKAKEIIDELNSLNIVQTSNYWTADIPLEVRQKHGFNRLIGGWRLKRKQTSSHEICLYSFSVYGKTIYVKTIFSAEYDFENSKHILHFFTT